MAVCAGIYIYVLLLRITNIEDGSEKQRDVNNAAHRKMRLEWGFVLLFLLSALRKNGNKYKYM